MGYKYSDVHHDWHYLFSVEPADDMTGGYVDQDDLKRMLDNPTKKQAVSCMVDQILYWFAVGPENHMKKFESSIAYRDYLINKDPRIAGMIEKYRCLL